MTPGDPATSMFAIVPLGPARMLRVVGVIYDSMVAVDVLGYFIDGGATPTAGRYRPIEPHRVPDTRQVGGSGVGGSGWVGPGVVRRPAGPVDDTSVTVSVDGVVPADSGAVLATAQLVDVAPMRTVSNLALVPVTDGRFEIDVQGRAHVVVDVVGSFTSAASAPGGDGRFVAATASGPLVPTAPNGTDPETRMFRRGVVGSVAVEAAPSAPSPGAVLVRLDAYTIEPAYVTLWGAGPVPWATALFNALRDPRHPGGRAGARRPLLGGGVTRCAAPPRRHRLLHRLNEIGWPASRPAPPAEAGTVGGSTTHQGGASAAIRRRFDRIDRSGSTTHRWWPPPPVRRHSHTDGGRTSCLTTNSESSSNRARRNSPIPPGMAPTNHELDRHPRPHQQAGEPSPTEPGALQPTTVPFS
ncbi:MAG: hypothetical protein R2755_12950 [Acidimicrobiales bacterium]